MSFEAEVVDIREASREGGRSVWQIALDRTLFAPGNTGWLEAVSPKGASIRVDVVDVEEDAAGEVWHVTRKPLLAGTSVTGEVAIGNQ